MHTQSQRARWGNCTNPNTQLNREDHMSYRDPSHAIVHSHCLESWWRCDRTCGSGNPQSELRRNLATSCEGYLYKVARQTLGCAEKLNAQKTLRIACSINRPTSSHSLLRSSSCNTLDISRQRDCSIRHHPPRRQRRRRRPHARRWGTPRAVGCCAAAQSPAACRFPHFCRRRLAEPSAPQGPARPGRLECPRRRFYLSLGMPWEEEEEEI